MSACNRRLALPRIAGMPLAAAVAWLAATTLALLGVISGWHILFVGTTASVAFAILCLRLGDDAVLWRAIAASLGEERCIAGEEGA